MKGFKGKCNGCPGATVVRNPVMLRIYLLQDNAWPTGICIIMQQFEACLIGELSHSTDK